MGRADSSCLDVIGLRSIGIGVAVLNIFLTACSAYGEDLLVIEMDQLDHIRPGEDIEVVFAPVHGHQAAADLVANKNFKLVINGIATPTLTSIASTRRLNPDEDLYRPVVYFDLNDTSAEARETWRRIARSTSYWKFDYDDREKESEFGPDVITILEGDSPVQGQGRTDVAMMDLGRLSVWALFFLVAVVVAILAVRKGRERSPDGVQRYAEDKRPLSLSLVQACIFTVVVPSAWLYVLFATGFVHLPANLIALLAISWATTGVSKTLPSQFKESTNLDKGDWLKRGIMGLLDGGDGAPAMTRAQLLIWTIGLNLLIIWRVAADAALPELDETLLALVGISGGVYIGPKAFLLRQKPQKQTIPEAPPPSDFRTTNPVSDKSQSLEFDGYDLLWKRGESTLHRWPAFSGQPDESSRESEKHYGPIPQGTYVVAKGSIEELEPTDDWGKRRVICVPVADTVKRMAQCFPSFRYGFYIHGGKNEGAVGCIRLIDPRHELAFFSQLTNHGATQVQLEVKYRGDRYARYKEPTCPNA